MMAILPSPSSLRRTMRARQTCFCGLFGSGTTVSRRRRSPEVSVNETPGRILQTSVIDKSEEHNNGYTCNDLSTRLSNHSRADASCGNISESCIIVMLWRYAFPWAVYAVRKSSLTYLRYGSFRIVRQAIPITPYTSSRLAVDLDGISSAILKSKAFEKLFQQKTEYTCQTLLFFYGLYV